MMGFYRPISTCRLITRTLTPVGPSTDAMLSPQWSQMIHGKLITTALLNSFLSNALMPRHLIWCPRQMSNTPHMRRRCKSRTPMLLLIVAAPNTACSRTSRRTKRSRRSCESNSTGSMALSDRLATKRRSVITHSWCTPALPSRRWSNWFQSSSSCSLRSEFASLPTQKAKERSGRMKRAWSRL